LWARLKTQRRSPPGLGASAGFCFVLVIAIALLIERRIPSFSVLYSNPLFQNWAHTIGELAHVSPANPIWLRWTGYLLLVAPFFDLDQHKSRTGVRVSVLTPLVCSRASRCNVCPHSLAGALGILLCTDLRVGAAAFTGAD